MFILLLLPLGALIVSYLVTMRTIASRIKAVSSTTWSSLGQPDERYTGANLRSLEAVFALRSYVHLKGEYKKLSDAQLTRLVWLARLLLVLFLADWIFAMWWMWTSGFLQA